uniref:CAF17-like 4Fe-4S cluster assembly/insertion protein YgfZ n=1 Tax=Cyanobium sp. TaxID=2164130 RepID=UPI00404A436C
LRLEGADTRRFLHGQTSAAIETAPAGAWIPSCSISPTARMRALVEVLLDPSESAPTDSNAGNKPGAWLVIHGIPPEAAAGVRQSLDRVLFPADQVHLGALETALLITPVGPGTAQLPASPKDAWQTLEADAGWLLGHQVLLRHGSEAPAWLAERALLSATGHERWRVQQAIPAAPGELSDDTNPFELGLAERVSLNKGCYVGQETLAKLSTYDGVKQQLRRWSCTPQAGELPAEQPGDPPAALTPGTTLYTPVTPGEGTSRAGVISSSLELKDGTWIGLALVRKQALEQPLLQAGDGPRPATLLLS